MKLAWIDALKVGASVYTSDDEAVVISPEFANKIVSNFDALQEKGYRVPLLRSHGRRDDYIYGDVHAMRIKDGYVQCGVTFTREEEKQAFNEGIMREYSPGFDENWLDPHTGNRMGPVLLELSFTGLAYQRNLRAPQEANPIQMSKYLFSIGGEMPEDKKEMMEETVEVVEEMAEPTLGDIASMLSQILQMLAPKEDLAEEPEEELMAEDEEKKEMSARIRQLEERAIRAELSALGIKGEDDVRHLIQLSRQSPELYKTTAKKLARPSVQVELGVMGATESRPVIDVEYVARAAKNASASAPGKLALFLSKNHPQFVDRTQEVRAAIQKL